MATETLRYDHPHHLVHQFMHVNCDAVAASTYAQGIHFPHGAEIKEISGIVETAGTNAAAGYDIYNGTTSVGAITFGTNAAKSTAEGSITPFTVTDDSYVEIRTKANSATMVTQLTIEFTPTVGSNVIS